MQRNVVFGNLLKGMLAGISHYEDKKAWMIEQEVGEQIGVEARTVQNYKTGAIPRDSRIIRILAEIAVRRAYLNRAWVRWFLREASYPTADELTRELFGGVDDTNGFVNFYPAAQLIASKPYQAYIRPRSFILAVSSAVPPITAPTEVHLCTIGRHHSEHAVDIVVRRSTVSRPHAFIRARVSNASNVADKVSFLLYDNDTLNGTYVNGGMIHSPRVLEDGDEIGLGTPEPMLSFSMVATTVQAETPALDPDDDTTT
jgi:hypothetical protein